MTGTWTLEASHSTAGLAAVLYDPFGRPPRANLDGQTVVSRARSGPR